VERSVRLEIVSHCWHYAPQLTYQLGSLAIFPPQGCEVTMTVWHSTEDRATLAVLDYFRRLEVPHVTWSFRQLPKERLFRRAIGRNLSALQTKADWIWFADVDMCFRENCLAQVTDATRNAAESLVFPRTIQISASHEEGDSALDLVANNPCVQDIDPAGFIPHHYPRAIGGVQIVRGEIARRLGYCRDSEKHQRPLARWQRTYDDVVFRRSLMTNGVGIELPGVYRIRHHKHGRRDEFGNLQNKDENGQPRSPDYRSHS